MARIIIYSGSFCPIHRGHIALAQHALSVTDNDELWILVSPNNPLKDPNELWDEQLRLRLAEQALKDSEATTATKCKGKQLLASDFEFHLPHPSYTVDTLRALSREYKQHSFSLLIGSDNMAVFDRWREYEYIMQHYQILVYPRRGDNTEQLQVRYPKMQLLYDAPMFDVSSTMIRNAIKRGESIEPYTTQGVARILQSVSLTSGE